jgi:hypothetical protein
MLHLILALIVIPSAHAKSVTSGVLFPKYQSRPVLALTSSEQREPPAAQINLLVSRAARICDYLQQPPGSFRSRRGVQILTRQFLHDGKLAALERGSSGKITGRLLSIAKEEAPSVVNSLKCVGTR